MDWIREAGKVLHSAEQMVVAINIIRWASWKGYPVEANSEKTGDVPRKAVRQALKLLEGEGLAKVEWREKRSPIVLDFVGCPLPSATPAAKKKNQATKH